MLDQQIGAVPLQERFGARVPLLLRGGNVRVRAWALVPLQGAAARYLWTRAPWVLVAAANSLWQHALWSGACCRVWRYALELVCWCRCKGY